MGSVHKTPGFSKRPNFWIFRNNRCWFVMIFDDYYVILLDVIMSYFIHVYTYITMYLYDIPMCRHGAQLHSCIYIYVYMHYVHQYMFTSTNTSYVNKPFTAYVCIHIHAWQHMETYLYIYIYTWTCLYIHIPRYPDTYTMYQATHEYTCMNVHV